MPEPFPIATMDVFARELLPQCHTEADRRAVQDGRESVPCLLCGCGYPWHVLEGVYWVE